MMKKLIEILEERRLFAVLVGAELRVFGTGGSDILRVSQQDAATIRVEENGVVSFFADANVNVVRMNVTPAVLGTGTAGNDAVHVVAGPTGLVLDETVIAFGGDGADNIIGGGGNDSLRGE